MTARGQDENSDVRPRRVKVVQAAGGVLWRRHVDGAIELLIVFRSRYDDWSFPKGKLHRDESFAQAAQREIFEETGYDVSLGEPLGTINYELLNGRAKEVRYWEVELPTGHEIDRLHLEQQDEITNIRWVGVDEARTLLSYESEVSLINDLLAHKSR